MNTQTETLNEDDMLIGTGAIAHFLWGDEELAERVRYMHRRKLLPTFKHGYNIAMRISAYREYQVKQAEMVRAEERRFFESKGLQYDE